MNNTGTMGNMPEQKLGTSAKQSTMGGSEQALKMGETPLDKGLGVYEIAENTTIEEMKAIFWDEKALVAPAYRLYQLNSRGKRFYYYLSEDGRPTFMPSVTTILGSVMPENTFLTDWKLSLGKDKAEAYTAERAAYGTFMHGCFEQLIINRRYDLDSLRENLAKYIEREKLPTSFINYAEDLKKDVLAFARWIKDYDVRPIAVEVSLYHPELGYAGMVDLVASVRQCPVEDEKKALAKAQAAHDKAMAKADEANSKAITKAKEACEKAIAKAKEDATKIAEAKQAYEDAVEAAKEALSAEIDSVNDQYRQAVNDARAAFGQRRMGIVDFKSGRKGFYEEHQHQLNLYRLMWDANYPEYPIDFIANFSPKDWRTAPSYNYKDQTDGQPLDKTLLFVQLFNMENNSDKTLTVVSGTIDLDAQDDFEGNVANVSLEDLVKDRNKGKDVDPEPKSEAEKAGDAFFEKYEENPTLF